MQKPSVFLSLVHILATPRYSHWSLFESYHIAGNSSESVVPYPSQHRRRRLYSKILRRGALSKGDLSGFVESIVCLGEATAYEEDVAGPEGDALLLDELLDLVHGDWRAGEGIDGDRVALAERDVIQEHPTADNASFLNPR